MSHETLTSVFGWMTVLNFGVLIFGTLILTGMRQTMIRIHSSMLDLEEADLTRVYVNWMSNYKVLALVFCLTPYIALKLAA